jgi:hypothetical protein
MIFKLSKKAVAPVNAPPLPPIHKQAANYARAQGVAVRQVIKGADVFRSKEETTRLVEHHCKGHGTGEICDRYRFVDQKCATCGCPVMKRAGMVGLGCPLRKFR